ncbi:uncharacterized protein TNCV_1825241 [Trichonephila clavipes]|nr:uncharacterized protein TNCV_1825241 [Trichonephila clavipes]
MMLVNEELYVVLAWRKRVQSSNPVHYPGRQNFCQWVIQNPALLPDFIDQDEDFTDEATFTQQVLPELLQKIPIVIRNGMWFQHGEVPTHFSIDVRPHLNATFGTRWIRSGESVILPPESPNLSSLDYFLWRHPKNLVHAIPLDSDEDPVARISEAASRVQEIPVIFKRVRESHHRSF